MLLFLMLPQCLISLWGLRFDLPFPCLNSHAGYFEAHHLQDFGMICLDICYFLGQRSFGMSHSWVLIYMQLVFCTTCQWVGPARTNFSAKAAVRMIRGILTNFDGREERLRCTKKEGSLGCKRKRRLLEGEQKQKLQLNWKGGELERETAREALLKMEKTVEMDENYRFVEDQTPDEFAISILEAAILWNNLNCTWKMRRGRKMANRLVFQMWWKV